MNPATETRSLAVMRDDHRRFEDLFETVLSQLDTGDKTIADEGWSTLERTLSEHIDYEEREVFPRFAEGDGGEVKALLVEHERFRALLTELGVALELCALPEESAKEFFDLLRAHAAREDGAFARWYDAKAPAGPQR